MESELRELLRRKALMVTAPADIPYGTRRRARLHRLLVGVASTALVLAWSFGGVAIVRSRDSMMVPKVAKGGPHSGLLARVGRIRDIAVGRGAVWIAGSDGVGRIDPKSGRITLTLDLRPFVPNPDRERASRPDFRRLELGSFALSVSGNSVWVLNYHAESEQRWIARIDARTGRVIDTLALDFATIGSGRGIAAGYGSAWVVGRPDSRGHDAEVWRVTDNRIQGRITVQGADGGIALGEGGIWALQGIDTCFGGRCTLSRIDPKLMRVTGIYTVPGFDRIDVATGLRAVWVLDSSGLVSRVDRESGSVLSSQPIEQGLVGYRGISVAEGAVWVLALEPTAGSFRVEEVLVDNKRTWRFNALKVGADVSSFSVGEGALWIGRSNGVVSRFSLHTIGARPDLVERYPWIFYSIIMLLIAVLLLWWSRGLRLLRRRRIEVS